MGDQRSDAVWTGRGGKIYGAGIWVRNSHEKELKYAKHIMIEWITEQPCCRVADLYSYIEWEVMLMDKKPFDFKDLMAFGMFILALLTFVFAGKPLSYDVTLDTRKTFARLAFSLNSFAWYTKNVCTNYVRRACTVYLYAPVFFSLYLKWNFAPILDKNLTALPCGCM